MGKLAFIFHLFIINYLVGCVHSIKLYELSFIYTRVQAKQRVMNVIEYQNLFSLIYSCRLIKAHAPGGLMPDCVREG